MADFSSFQLHHGWSQLVSGCFQVVHCSLLIFKFLSIIEQIFIELKNKTFQRFHKSLGKPLDSFHYRKSKYIPVCEFALDL